jgi:XTP/dITP diphosphohydrolase
MTFVIASHNEKKKQEIERILGPLGIEFVTEKDLGTKLPDPEETGTTFAENAYIKAECTCRECGLPAIADDSGLCVDALGGAPGVYSARYSGVHGDDKANNRKLLSALADVPDEKRTAHYECAVCVVFPDGKTLTANGTCQGVIGRTEQGSNGFGYDPLFYRDGKSFGDTDPAEKDKVSHRSEALRKMKKELENI